MGSAGDKLLRRQRNLRSRLCIGLDPDNRFLPPILRTEPHPWKKFLHEIIASTQEFACAYKLNLTFYEQFGTAGWELLEDTLAALPAESLAIADAKRGDVPHTAEIAARTLFEIFPFDAVTLNPLLGADSVTPFLSYSDKLVFLLARTSNAGASDFLTLRCQDGRPLFAYIILQGLHWGRQTQIGFVVGATAPEDFTLARALAPTSWFLVPGVGHQGGDLSQLLAANQDGPLVVNVGRSILYASPGPDFADAAARAAQAFAREIGYTPTVE
ncbi:MAG: orotidine-5'-phosphate decarboxylase [Chlorobiota bacterium]